jgi:hypothetical protein
MSLTHVMFKNRRCPNPQQVQSVECSNVGKLTRAALIIERMQQCAALMIESVGGAGLLWSVAMFEHSTDCTCCDFGHLQFFQIFYMPPNLLPIRCTFFRKIVNLLSDNANIAVIIRFPRVV